MKLIQLAANRVGTELAIPRTSFKKPQERKPRRFARRSRSLSHRREGQAVKLPIYEHSSSAADGAAFKVTREDWSDECVYSFRDISDAWNESGTACSIFVCAAGSFLNTVFKVTHFSLIFFWEVWHFPRKGPQKLHHPFFDSAETMNWAEVLVAEIKPSARMNGGETQKSLFVTRLSTSWLKVVSWRPMECSVFTLLCSSQSI